jgi:hypothetical protein
MQLPQPQPQMLVQTLMWLQVQMLIKVEGCRAGKSYLMRLLHLVLLLGPRQTSYCC